jgi:hypothetical protein
MNKIEFRADHRLSDTMALQFFILRNHLLRRSLFLAAFLLLAVVLTTLMNGAPLADSLADLEQNAGMKFNRLYMRLPKRGFSPDQDALLREIALVAVPRAANRLRV